MFEKPVPGLGTNVTYVVVDGNYAGFFVPGEALCGDCFAYHFEDSILAAAHKLTQLGGGAHLVRLFVNEGDHAFEGVGAVGDAEAALLGDHRKGDEVFRHRSVATEQLSFQAHLSEFRAVEADDAEGAHDAGTEDR